MRKGFTLIELLAVIVILAIIALIATPIVLSIINDSREVATLRSAEFYLDAVKLSIAKYKLSNSELVDGIYLVNKKGNLCKEIDGISCKNDFKISVDNEKPSIGSKIEIKAGTIVYENTVIKLNNYSCFKEESFKCIKGNLESISMSDNFLKIDTNENLYDYKIYGNSIQNSNFLIESVGEKTKNLWNEEWVNGTVNNDDGLFNSNNTNLVCTRDFINLNPSTEYTLNVGAGNTAWIFQYDSEKNYLGVEKRITVNNFLTFTIDNNAQYIKFYMYTGYGNTYKNDVILSLGSTVEEYEPYGYKIPIKISGKNISIENRTDGVLPSSSYQPTAEKLFEEDKFYRGIASSGYYGVGTIDKKATFENGVYTVYGGGYGVGLPVKVKPNTKYSISFGEKTGEARWAFYDEKGVYITWNNKTTFITPENCYWVVITLRPSEEATFSKIQLEEGSSVTTYEPYKEKLYNIYLDEPLRKVGDSADYIDFINKKIVRNVDVVDGVKLQELSSPKIENIELPEIELYKGINYLKVDTKVIPSKVIIKYYK